MVLKSDYTPRTRSRLALRQQKKIVKQSILYIVLAIGLGVLFIFVILPRTISLLFSTSGNNISLTNQDKLPPQIPIIAAPATATSATTLTVKGYGEPESTVVLLQNGSKVSEFTVENDGTFSQEIELIDGPNTISAYSTDVSGNESEPSHAYTINKDSTAPTLEIFEPTEGQSYKLARNQTITIKGTTESKSKIMVNGRLTLANAQGEFSTSYFLQEGETELTITSTDEAGNSTEKKLKVSFSLQ